MGSFYEDLKEKIEAYEACLEPTDQAKAVDDIMECLASRLYADGFDSVWYARVNDRVKQESYYSNWRNCDNATFHGLIYLIQRWGDNIDPVQVVTVEG